MQISRFSLLCLLALSFAAPALAGVTGEDNLIDYKDLARFSIPDLAKATATQLQGGLLKQVNKEISTYRAMPLQNLCPGERFAKVKPIGECSGFLVSSDILVTAGHCSDEYEKNRCGDDTWLFNYFSATTSDSYTLQNRDIYRCQNVLEYKHSDGIDYAVIRLDRPVKGVTPFTPNLGDDVAINDPISVLGYPLGLPFTYSPGGSILDFDGGIMHGAGVDAYSKNSGSVVLNMRTGRAEGILTQGTEGLSLNIQDGCMETKFEKNGITTINRLDQIPYLKEHFSSFSKLKTYSLVNSCAGTVKVVSKLRSPRDNALVTEVNVLRAGETATLQARNSLWVNAADENGNAVIRGKDFYGFEDGGRDPELAFKEFSTPEIRLCP